MRHPIEAWDDKRICPITNKLFDECWSDEDLYDSCHQCKPEGLTLAERLKELNEKRKKKSKS
jgi:hypothetical protein